MANYAQIFQQAQAAIASVAGEQVTYSRGSNSIIITMVPAVSYQTADGQQVVSEYRSRDFVGAVADLVMNGSPVLPQRGDTITETVAGQIYTWQVGRPQGGKEQPYRYSDTGNTHVRVHTVLTGITT